MFFYCEGIIILHKRERTFHNKKICQNFPSISSIFTISLWIITKETCKKKLRESLKKEIVQKKYVAYPQEDFLFKIFHSASLHQKLS
jgi:uncharacterized protein YrrD